MRSLRQIFVFLLTVLLCDGAYPSFAAEGHLPVGPERAQLRGAPPAPSLPRRPVNQRQGSHLLLEDDRRLDRFDLDYGLTELCRLGRFRQKRDRFLIVRLGGYTHGAVVGGHWALYDPEGLAVPDLVYAVRGQDTARCRVYVIRHLEPGL